MAATCGATTVAKLTLEFYFVCLIFLIQGILKLKIKFSLLDSLSKFWYEIEEET